MLRKEKEFREATKEYSFKVGKQVSKIMFKVLCRLSTKETDKGLTSVVKKLIRKKEIYKEVQKEAYRFYQEEQELKVGKYFGIFSVSKEIAIRIASDKDVGQHLLWDEGDGNIPVSELRSGGL